MAPLKYLSDRALAQLRSSIAGNLDRYRKSGFAEWADDPAWDIRLGVEYDEKLLATMDLATPRAIATVDLANSRIVGKALRNLTPALANEERVWVRLAHVEAFAYCRTRWIAKESNDKLVEAIGTHFFAASQTAIRDDNALSRLWWNYEIARTCMPENPDKALGLILMTTDIRSNFVERIWMTSRRGIASAVLRQMSADSWVTAAEQNFRKFMIVLNRLGGGVVFETFTEAETDMFVRECIRHARSGR